MRETPTFFNPSIIEESGGVVWTSPELLVECERRKDQAEGKIPATTDDIPATTDDARFD